MRGVHTAHLQREFELPWVVHALDNIDRGCNVWKSVLCKGALPHRGRIGRNASSVGCARALPQVHEPRRVYLPCIVCTFERAVVHEKATVGECFD